jgi:heat shock protein HtpX
MSIATTLRTGLLLALLTGILLAAGFFFAGTAGMTLALGFAMLLNFTTYWWSDKIVLAMYRAKPSKDKKLHMIVEKLAKEAGIPKPKVYAIPTAVPNAFATGRSPAHAAVAATEGLLDALSDDEIEGVLAHELAHIKSRDTLISTLAATIGGAVSFLAQLAWWSLFMGGRREGGSLILLPLLFLAPVAAALVQLAISRGREYFADYTGAYLSRKPLALASALEKISVIAKAHPLRGNAATAHLFIVNPLRADVFARLFSTHPPLAERTKRLRALAKELR